MSNPLAQVGETYKGWEILEIIPGEKGGFKYITRCLCGLEKFTTHTDLKNKILEGCKKCASNKRINCVKIGSMSGDFVLIDKLHSGKKRSYLFKCLKCDIEIIGDMSIKKKTKCGNCIRLNSPFSKIKKGLRIGSWIILEVFKRESRNSQKKVLCKCDCGTIKKVSICSIVYGETKACSNCSRMITWRKKISDIDHTGTQIGTFKAISKDGLSLVKYLFRCDICGYEIIQPYSRKIREPNCKGCRSFKLNNIAVDSIYGKWKVIKESGRDSVGNKVFLCECTCKRTRIIRGSDLLRETIGGCYLCAIPKKQIPIKPKLTEYNNIYLNFCIKPRPMDDIIEHTGRSLHEVQDQLIDLQLEGKIEINKEGLWETL